MTFQTWISNVPFPSQICSTHSPPCLNRCNSIFSVVQAPTLETFLSPLFLSHMYPAWKQILLALPSKYSSTDQFLTLTLLSPPWSYPPISHLACLQVNSKQASSHPTIHTQPSIQNLLKFLIMSCVCCKPYNYSSHHSEKMKAKVLQWQRKPHTISRWYLFSSSSVLPRSAPATFPPGNLLPQGLCINLTLCLGHSFPRYHSPKSFTIFTNVTFSMSLLGPPFFTRTTCPPHAPDPLYPVVVEPKIMIDS